MAVPRGTRFEVEHDQVFPDSAVKGRGKPLPVSPVTDKLAA